MKPASRKHSATSLSRMRVDWVRSWGMFKRDEEGVQVRRESFLCFVSTKRYGNGSEETEATNIDAITRQSEMSSSLRDGSSAIQAHILRISSVNPRYILSLGVPMSLSARTRLPRIFFRLLIWPMLYAYTYLYEFVSMNSKWLRCESHTILAENAPPRNPSSPAHHGTQSADGAH